MADALQDPEALFAGVAVVEPAAQGKRDYAVLSGKDEGDRARVGAQVLVRSVALAQEPAHGKNRIVAARGVEQVVERSDQQQARDLPGPRLRHRAGDPGPQRLPQQKDRLPRLRPEVIQRGDGPRDEDALSRGTGPRAEAGVLKQKHASRPAAVGGAEQSGEVGALKGVTGIPMENEKAFLARARMRRSAPALEAARMVPPGDERQSVGPDDQNILGGAGRQVEKPGLEEEQQQAKADVNQHADAQKRHQMGTQLWKTAFHEVFILLNLAVRRELLGFL